MSQNPPITAEDLVKMEPGRQYRAVVIALDDDRALLELDSGEKIWTSAAPRIHVGQGCVISRGTEPT